MPKREIEIFEDLSFEDLRYALDRVDDVDAKLDYLTNYIMSYGMDGRNENVRFEDLITFSRNEYIRNINEAKNLYCAKNFISNPLPATVINPNGYKKNPEYEQMEKDFLRDPITYLRNYAAKMANFEPKNENEQKYKNNCQRLLANLNELDPQVDYNERFASRLMIYRLNRNIIKDRPYSAEELLVDDKRGGFFERLFNTTSEEYRAFEATFRAFNDPDSPSYNNLDNLEASTNAYLHHKLPNLNDGEIPNYEEYQNMSRTSKKRIMFCCDVLQAIKEQRKAKEDLNIYKEDNTNIVQKSQSDFQEELNKNLNDNMIEKDNNIIELDNTIELDNSNEI